MRSSEGFACGKKPVIDDLPLAKKLVLDERDTIMAGRIEPVTKRPDLKPLPKRKAWKALEAQRIIPELESKAEPKLGHDSSTNNLIRRCRKFNPHCSWGFVTKPRRRQPRRPRGGAREGGVLETGR